MSEYRVVFGETMPAWERIFPTLREAKRFAVKHEGMGDVIFSVAKVVPGEPPQSMAAFFAQEEAKAGRTGSGEAA